MFRVLVSVLGYLFVQKQKWVDIRIYLELQVIVNGVVSWLVV